MPSDFLVLQYLPYLLPLALPALWLLRCLVSLLLGRGRDGGCVLCYLLAAAGFTFWPEVAPFYGVDGPWRTFSLPDDIGLRLLIIGFLLLGVGLLLYAIPWLVRRIHQRQGRPGDQPGAEVWNTPGSDDDALDRIQGDFAEVGLDRANVRD